MDIDKKAYKVYLEAKTKDLTKVNLQEFSNELNLTIKEVASALKRLEEEYGLIKIINKRLSGDWLIDYTGRALRDTKE